MKKTNFKWVSVTLLFVVISAICLTIFIPVSAKPWEKKKRIHMDHASFFNKPFATPGEVTRACLQCHPDAAKDLMKTTHWCWECAMDKQPAEKKRGIGKKPLLKFFDTGSKDDTSSCTRCHIGYGWIDDSFDFSREENVDCLVCHDWTAAYTKGRGGMPAKDVDLLEVARRVGYPWRDNCGSCHLFGNRGMGIKHGDLDSSLLNPTENTDVHMGKHSFLCIDCHKASNHKIAGKAYLVNPGHEKGIKCTHCHLEPPHNDSQINMHLSSVACQTCHIPEFAKKFPTKIGWDQSKGQFLYGKNVVPVYYWFNLKSHRLIPGDKITPGETTYLNKPDGDISQRASLIRPFKTFQSMLPYDNLSNRLLPPLNIQQKCLQSESEFSRILIANAGKNNIPYTGKYTLIKTVMLRPLSHMVAPANKALQCIDCHGANSRMDWKALGYEGDPEVFGGRNTD